MMRLVGGTHFLGIGQQVLLTGIQFFLLLKGLLPENRQ
jgi:hypothetical protein